MQPGATGTPVGKLGGAGDTGASGAALELEGLRVFLATMNRGWAGPVARGSPAGPAAPGRSGENGPGSS